MVAGRSTTRTCERLCRAHKVGQVQFDNFVRERLVERTKPIEDAIHRNKLKIFSQHASKPQAKGKQQIKSLNNDMDLLSSLRLVLFLKYFDTVGWVF